MLAAERRRTRGDAEREARPADLLMDDKLSGLPTMYGSMLEDVD
jgi:hypothetical protein